MSTGFARNSIYGAAAGASVSLGGFICSIIVARVLGVESTGAIAFALWLVTLMASVIDLGAQPTLSRFIPNLLADDDTEAAQALTRAAWTPVALACVVTLIGFTAYSYSLHINAVKLRFGLNAFDWIVVGVLCILQATTGYTFGYFRGIQRFDRVAHVTIVSFAVQLVAVFLGAWLYGVSGALLGYCMGAATTASLQLAVPRTRAQLTPHLKQRALRYAVFAWGGAIITTFVWSRVEVLFLQAYWGNAEVGLFFVCLSFATLATQGPTLMTAGLLPYFSERFGRESDESAQTAYGAATRTMAFVVFPMCFGTAAILPAIVPLVYGTAFAGAVPAATIIVSIAALGAVGSVGASIVFGAERSDFGFYSGLLGGVLSVLAGFFVIPTYGLIGAAWSRALIQALLVGVGFWFIHRRLKCPVPFAGLLRIFLAASLCAIAARLTIIVIPGYGGLVIAILTGAIVYVVLARVFGTIPHDDAKVLQRFAGKLPARLDAVASSALRFLSPAMSR